VVLSKIARETFASSRRENCVRNQFLAQQYFLGEKDNTMKQYRRIGESLLILLTAMPFAGAQTKIDLATQSKHVDFSGASTTKPAKVSTAIPAMCSIGEIFFDTNAPAGQNLYGCTATNTWNQLGGNGAGAGMASQLLDFNVNNTSGTVQTLGALCSGTTPCQIRTSTAFFVMTTPVTGTLSGAVTSGTVFWYLSSSQIMTAGHNSAATLSCSAGCSVATGITAFPPDSLPLFQTTFTANAWDVINPPTMDKRAIYSRNVIASGQGVASAYDPTTGIQTLSTDPTLVPRYFAGSGAPALTCSTGRDFYVDTTAQLLYFCSGLNTWKQSTDPLTTPRYFSGPGAPSITCAVGRDFYVDTTAQLLYFCSSLNTWKQSTDPLTVPRYFSGSGAPSITCTVGRDFYTDTTNQHLYFCDAANTWKQADPGSRTDVQNFVLAGSSAVGGGVVSATYSSVAAGTFSATGPNTISYTVAGLPLAVNGALMAAKKASPTWSGAAGSVDLTLVASNADGVPAAGNWTLTVYVGCAASNGAFTYGTASTISAVPPGLHNFQRYSTTGLSLPVSCAASSPMQFWVQRAADSGGTTGVSAFLIAMEVVMRGN